MQDKTTKFLGENIEGNLHDIRFGNGFQDMIIKHKKQRTGTQGLTCFKGHEQESEKRQNGRKQLQIHITNKKSVPRLYKNSHNSITKRPTTQ